MKDPFKTPAARLVALLLAGLVLGLFFYRAGELPLAHGDERAFLDVPYRFATFGDLHYPIFMSESFGASELRPYPPITALALRSAAVKMVGFSARHSRMVSGVMIGLVLVAAGFWMRARFNAPWPLLALALAPSALAPVVILAARTTRLEQETFFFGVLSALLLAGGATPGLTRSPTRLLLAGAFAAIASGMHPFGVVYGGLSVIALIAARRPKDLWAWLGGALMGALPTIWWVFAKGQDLVAFAAVNGTMYQNRERDLTEWLAQFSNVSWLKSAGLGESLLARLASVQHSAFSDYVGFPLETGLLSMGLRGLFWIEVLFVGRFLFRHLRNRHPEYDGTAWLAILALGFLLFTFAYVPNTTYGLYGGFHVHLAFAAVCLAERGNLAVRKHVPFAAVSAAFLVAGLLSGFRLVSAPVTPTLDQELEAIARMARASGIGPLDRVMTSTETWIAAGARNASLLERIQYGLGSEAPDTVVYRRSYVKFYLGAGLPRDPARRAETLAERTAAMAGTLEGLRLAGLLIVDEARDDAFYYYRRGDRGEVSVASIDPARIIPLQIASTEASGPPGPRILCDGQPLPLCTYHER